MKMLVQRTPQGSEQPYNLADVKLYLRVDHGVEDAVIANAASSAAAELEHFAQIALLSTTIRATILNPNCDADFRLPVGPVDQSNSPSVSVDGIAFTDFEFVSGIRPLIFWGESWSNLRPTKLEIEYTAGFGGSVADIPNDIVQAVMDQTALHYDCRGLEEARLLTSAHFARIGARYRGVLT